MDEWQIGQKVINRRGDYGTILSYPLPHIAIIAIDGDDNNQETWDTFNLTAVGEE